MARKILLDPEIFLDPDFGAMSIVARFLFLGLLSHADRDGWVDADPRWLKSQIFLYDDNTSVQDVAAAVREILRTVPGVELWQGSDSEYLRFHGCVYFDRSRRTPKIAIPSDLRLAVFARDGHACLRCGALANLAADHIRPESEGGPTTIENLQTLCRSCNSRKGTKTINYRSGQVS